jgi:hypothetical protein
MNGQPALPQLRQIITERFSEEELRNLCFDLMNLYKLKR